VNAPVYDGIATDGNRLYVMQNAAPFLWSIDVRGGASLDLYSQGVPGVDQAGPGWPMLALDGGIYFNAPTGPASVMWINGMGGPLRTVVEPEITVFDRSGTRGFRYDPDLGTLDSVAFSDGSSQPFAVLPSLVLGFGVSDRFFHVLTTSDPWLEYSDRRFNLSDGTFHDEVGLDVDGGDLVAGPNAVCLMPLVPGNVLTCLADDKTQPDVFTLSGFHQLYYVDDTWAYVGAKDDLSRVSLADGHAQIAIASGHPLAVTSAGGCVYVVAMVDPTSSVVWRVSP
jgi:hypothetical protein